MAGELVRYELREGGSILVEVAPEQGGYERCARTLDGVIDAGRNLESMFAQVVPSARAIVRALAELRASEVQVEFGIKLAGEAGVVIARSSIEAHFNVRMAFQPGVRNDP